MREATMQTIRRVSAVAGAALLAGWGGFGLSQSLGLRRNETAVAVFTIGAALVGVAVAGFAVIMLAEARCRHLLHCGVPAEATILRVRRTGGALHSRHEPARPFLRVDLEAHVPSHPPIHTHTIMAMHESEADALVPGLRVPIRYDPEHPARVALEMAR